MRYVIQKHEAKNIHYDLRLELDGVARSWAIPKGPSDKPGEKRLAVEVDDHEISYMDFEGEIPEGQYGAGKVTIWDRGSWEKESVKNDKIVGIIHGEKLDGRYTLVRMKGKNWLFFKTR